MAFLDRFREKEFVRTNWDGAKNLFPVGSVATANDGTEWRVTRHTCVQTVPWATIVVYGVRL